MTVNKLFVATVGTSNTQEAGFRLRNKIFPISAHCLGPTPYSQLSQTNAFSLKDEATFTALQLQNLLLRGLGELLLQRPSLTTIPTLLTFVTTGPDCKGSPLTNFI